MPLQEIYLITEILVGFGFIISIVFLAVQMRQNSFLLRNSMAVQARQRTYWLNETLCINNDFRAFHRRIDTDWENFNEDERYRASALAVTGLRSVLDELAKSLLILPSVGITVPAISWLHASSY